MPTNGTSTDNRGRLLEIKGVVVDAVFPDSLPAIYSALSITRRAMRRRWVAATLAAQVDPPYLVDFMNLVADRALPVRATARASA